MDNDIRKNAPYETSSGPAAAANGAHFEHVLHIDVKIRLKTKFYV